MSRIEPAELEELKSREPLSAVLSRLGLKLTGRGTTKWSLSPFNAERSPSFKCDDRRGFYHCFSSGRHGDAVTACMEIRGLSFREAVEFLGGTRAVPPEQRRELQIARKKLEEEDERAAANARASVRRQFAAAAPIADTHAAAYLDARGIAVTERMWGDLRFAPRLMYRGYKDSNDREGSVLGDYPALLAAIRDGAGDIIGLHRTYLDPSAPKKLLPPGDKRRNKSKKILGEAAGGMIWLSPRTERHPDTLIMGEGIETSLSGYQLGGLIGVPDTAAVAAGVSLTNIAGGAKGTIPHPDHPEDTGRRLPNGDPDHDYPGILLPDWIETVILLMDGDSNPLNTRAQIVTGARRFADLERRVYIARAPEGLDHNDLLMAERGEVA